jgi:hypothetical protein
MYSAETRKKYAGLLQTATEQLAPMFKESTSCGSHKKPPKGKVSKNETTSKR